MDKGNFKSASCIIEDENIVVINKNIPMENRVQVLCEFLSKRNKMDFSLMAIEVEKRLSSSRRRVHIRLICQVGFRSQQTANAGGGASRIDVSV